MADVFPPEVRSRIMSRVRGRDTQPEKKVRSYLHRHGLRFRLHRRDLAGTPDLVFPSIRLALFVHGCFWHCHPGCSHHRIPKTRVEYWRSKLQGNVERDARNQAALRREGWHVHVIWECEVTEERLEALLEFVRGRVVNHES